MLIIANQNLLTYPTKSPTVTFSLYQITRLSTKTVKSCCSKPTENMKVATRYHVATIMVVAIVVVKKLIFVGLKSCWSAWHYMTILRRFPM